MNLELKIRNHEDVAVLACKGRLTGPAATYPFGEALLELLQHSRTVLVDLSGLEQIDCAAMGTLASAARFAKERRRTLCCFGAKHIVREALEVTGVSSILGWFDNEHQALAALHAHAA